MKRKPGRDVPVARLYGMFCFPSKEDSKARREVPAMKRKPGRDVPVARLYGVFCFAKGNQDFAAKCCLITSSREQFQ
jgi:hypothetical protein